MKWFYAVIALLVMALPALAQQQPTDAQLALTMTTNLYCGTLNILSAKNNNIGLFLGFSIALYGLYVLISTASMRGIYIIICGALLTALPGVIITGLKGTNALLYTNGKDGISTRQTLQTPNCP